MARRWLGVVPGLLLLGLGAWSAAAARESTTSGAVFATDFLPGDYLGGQEATRVTLEGWAQETYSGFFRFNASGRAVEGLTVNTFFWFLPSEDGNPDAPVVLWLQGGPGASSLFGMFTEIGPFTINADMEVVPLNPEYSWNRNYSLLFLDNPVGAGYSFTDDRRAMVTNEKQVGSDLHAALLQFFQLFPDLRANDFFVTGESYAGKYVPACAFTIDQMNQQATVEEEKINLKGMSIGDGAMDPAQQFRGFGHLLFNIGMVNLHEKRQFEAYDAKMEEALAGGDFLAAFDVFDEMLNGDFYPYGTYYTNVTGLTNYFNYEQGDAGNGIPDYFTEWLALPEVKDAIHVGDLPYHSFNGSVEEHLKADWMRGVLDMVVPILENPDYRVLIYSGQNDVILGAALTEQMLDSLQWQGLRDFREARKSVWRIPEAADPVAGYITNVPTWKFTYAVVRGAGHMVPTDQPERASDLITTFISGGFLS